MADYRVISSDSHIFEPADMWTTRVEPKFRDRAPRIVRLEEDHSDWWFCEGVKMMGAFLGGGMAGVRFEEPEKLTLASNLGEVRPGSYIPEEHVKDLDVDGIDVGIIYPTEGLMLYSLPDGKLLTALFNLDFPDRTEFPEHEALWDGANYKTAY